jgi:hypothetical protein
MNKYIIQQTLVRETIITANSEAEALAIAQELADHDYEEAYIIQETATLYPQ